MVSYLATLHSLSEAMGTTAHHPGAVHGPNLRYRILSILSFLLTFGLL